MLRELVLTLCALSLPSVLVYLMSRSPQVRAFLNLLPPSEGDSERFDATQSLEVSSMFRRVYIPRLTLISSQ